MRYGSPYASGYGNPKNWYQYVIYDKTEFAARNYMNLPLRFKLRASPVMYPCYHHVYINSKKVATIRDEDGSEIEYDAPIPYGSNSLSYEVYRVGQLGDESYECARCIRIAEHSDGFRPTLQFTFKPVVVEPERNQGSGLSAWSISGLVLGQNTAYVAGHPTWGRLDYDLLVTGSDATLNLYQGTRLVASGTTAVLGAPYPLTFTERDNSGISGSVTVSHLAGVEDEGIIDARWPESMKIKRDTTDPPTTIVATVPFKGENTVRWTEPSELAAGTYYYRVQPFSDTQKLGTISATITIVVLGAPLPPDNLAFGAGTSGNFSLTWTVSGTGGATYRIYGPTAIGGVANMNTPIATALAGATSVSGLSVGAGATGKVQFIIRAVSGGIEERTGSVVEIEFNGGTRITPRPNTPGIVRDGISINELTASIPVTYDPIREKATATHIYLYKRAYPSGSYPALGSPDAVAALADIANGLKKATVNYVFSAAGYYAIKALAATAASGGVESDNAEAEALEQVVLPSDATLPAAENVSGELARG